MQTSRSTAEAVSETYYNSSDADRFYELIWGGEDIHIGLYEPGLSIYDASRNTVEFMAGRLQRLDANSRVLDLGAGYGGSARYLVDKTGCHVTCVNISEVQNERNRMLNITQGLDDHIDVLHGSFESIPSEDSSADIVWSQDAFLHSDTRAHVIAEIDRVLKAGGELIFTDPMQADDCPAGVLQPVYDRLSLTSLSSFAWYRQALKQAGFTEAETVELTHQLRTHYATVKANLESRYDELVKSISHEYMDKMLAGLQNWVTAADKGYLAWGVLYFVKDR